MTSLRPHQFQDQLRLKKRRWRLKKLGLLAGAVFLLAGLAVYLLFFAGLFEIRAVEINGSADSVKADTEQVVSSWLDEKSFVFRHRSNSVIFSPAQLSAKLIGSLPRIESLEIRRESRHKLKINIIERRPIGVWCLTWKQECYFFDKNTVAYEKAGVSEGFILTLVNDRREREMKIGSAVASKDWLNNIIGAKELLQKNGLEIASFSIPDNSLNEFSARVVEDRSDARANWQILFNNGTNIPQQINSLINLLKNKLTKGQRAKLQYVDLRIQDRIYWK
ncbi:MAG: hypothetical protein AAB585_00500 [Patescibacteria group bacterium]